MKKKIIALSLIVALVAVAVIGASLAYFTDTSDTAENVFTIGNVDIELAEESWVPEDAENVYPGQTLPKDPTVENTGANPCFVRLHVTGLDALGSADNLLITLDEIGENWVVDGEYIYYTVELAAGDTTPAAFQSITIPAAADGSVTDGTVYVTAEAIQSQGFDDYTAAFAAFDAE